MAEYDLLSELSKESTLSSILAKLADPATETTLEAILDKLIAAPATQTTLAAVLAALQAGLRVTINENYPSLRYYSTTESQPTTNPDGSALIKYSTLWDMDTGAMYSYNGNEWVVME